MINEKVDIKENKIIELDFKILEILLKDQSSRKNLLWGTDNYSSRGHGYQEYDHITLKAITGRNGFIIKPRIEKSRKEQILRVKKKAEVFTPSWICNEMINNVDNEYFGNKNTFNTSNGESWIVNPEKIKFKNIENHNWMHYVKQNALEITCGEAPYLISRYDTVTGEWIDTQNRIGVLDRKLRVVNENVETESEWLKWVYEAYKATYGYEWQGDSLLIARENMLFTFIDYYFDKFKQEPPNEHLIEIATILSWNIWQMDGIRNVVPNSCKPTPKLQMSFFEEDNKTEDCEGCLKGRRDKHTGIYCKIKNWKTKRNVKFNNIKGEGSMKFDFVIGNPPYQEKSLGDKKADNSIYHHFMDAAYKVSDKVLLITPAKFLFDNGNTPSAWNKKMLNDVHFKVLFYEPVSNNIFNNVSFKGGIAIHYRNKKKIYEPILQFSQFKEINSILKKVLSNNDKSLITIIYNQNKFNLKELYKDFSDIKELISSEGKEKRMTSGSLSYNCFNSKKTSNNDIQILGLIKNERVFKYINRKYLEESNENIDKYKVIVPANNGSGAIGEVLSTPLIGEPLIGEPLIGYTQTFIGIGAFDTRDEVKNAFKYVKSKFCRLMLGVLKVTQNGKKPMWRYVPLQNFTNSSDIDWSKSINEIDKQLYKKYNLDNNEIAFIEKNIKEMD